MSFWILKIATQELYPDDPGEKYVYDNTHSTRVVSGDSFVYLDKRQARYGFTGHGPVRAIGHRSAKAT